MYIIYSSNVLDIENYYFKLLKMNLKSFQLFFFLLDCSNILDIEKKSLQLPKYLLFFNCLKILDIKTTFLNCSIIS